MQSTAVIHTLLSAIRFCLYVGRHGLWLTWLAAPGLAQTNEELFREYQFNFTLPGARANGMGGAFIGVADDAASSFANPAGLAFLNETAVTLEYRNRRLEGRVGEIAGNFNTQFEQQEEHFDSISFISLNLRWKSWFFGIFQYEFLDESQRRNFRSRSLSDGVQRIESRDIALDLGGKARGVGAARRFGKFKLGATLQFMELAGETQYQREGFIISGTPQSFFYQSLIDDKDQAWGYNIGLLHEPSDSFSWGAVWRENPKFGLEERVFEEINGQPLLIDSFAAPFVVPDVFGLGARYKIRPDLGILFDWQQIFYSQIIEDGFVIVESLNTETKENYAIEDIGEFHIGLEWFIPGEHSVWALRGGYYRNPRHAVTYRGNDPAIQDRFAGTGLTDEDHFTFGAGWVFRNRLEVDLAANFWEAGREWILSLIWRKK